MTDSELTVSLSAETLNEFLDLLSACCHCDILSAIYLSPIFKLDLSVQKTQCVTCSSDLWLRA